MFDPWNATFEEAVEAQGKCGTVGPATPLFQAGGARNVIKMREMVESGDGFAVLRCVAQCAVHDLVMPPWLVSQFLQKFRAVELGNVLSWDDELAFGKPYKKGTQKGKPASRVREAVEAWNIANEIFAAEPVTPKDNELWERIGEAMDPKVGGTTARKAYYRAEAFFGGNTD